MTPTRYPPLKLDKLDKAGREWSFFDCSDGEDRVGEIYATKGEALIDLPRYAKEYGCA
jgi:hypothetical protein